MEGNHIPESDAFAGLSESERIVAKILEYDILDPVWFEVLRRHPDLQVRSDGKQIELERNHNLRHHINTVDNISLPDYHSDVQTIGNFITTIDLNGRLQVRTSKDLQEIFGAELSLRQGNPVVCPAASLANLVPPNSAITAPSSNEPFPASHFITKALHMNPPKDDPIEDCGGDGNLQYQGRQVVLGLDLMVEPISAEAIAAAQKAAKGKKDAPPIDLKPKKTLKYRIVVIDLFANPSTNKARVEKVHDFYLDTETNYEILDINYALYNFINMDFAEDGRLLSIVVNSSFSFCQIYDTAEPKAFLPELSSATIEEQKIPPVSPRGVSSLSIPALVSYWRQEKSKGDEKTTALVKRLLIITEKEALTRNSFEKYVTDAQKAAHAKALAELEASKPKPSVLKKEDPPTPAPEPAVAGKTGPGGKQPAPAAPAGKPGAPAGPAPISPRASLPPMVPLRKDYYPSLRILTIVHAVPLVVIYRLALKPEEPPKPVDPKAKPPEKAKGAADTPLYPHMLCPCVPFEEIRWRLTGCVTAWSFFGNRFCREYIALGTLDGIISAWDVCRNINIRSLGRHPGAITSISAIYDHYSASANILSGSVDGTVTLYSNRPGPDNGSSSDIGAGGEDGGSFLDYYFVATPLHAMKLVNYRYDAHKHAVIQTKLLVVKNDNHNQLSEGDSIDSMKRYLGLVQYSNGIVGIYDCSSLTPMGSLSREEKLQYEPQPSLFIAGNTIPKRRFLFIDPEPDPALLEPTPAPAKGKGAPVPEPVVEVPSDEVKEVVIEKEKVIESFPEVAQLKSLIEQGCGLEAYAYVSAMTDIGNGLLTINERVGNPVISKFDMNDALEGHIKRMNEPTGFQFNVSPQLASRKAPSTTMSIISKVSRVKGIPSTANNSIAFRSLPKLTEETLQEHDQQYDSTFRKPSAWSALENRIKKSEVIDYDPQVLVKKELLELKKERMAGKLKLSKMMNTLISVLQDQPN